MTSSQVEICGFAIEPRKKWITNIIVVELLVRHGPDCHGTSSSS
jgi:hypothetical protein